MTELPFLTSNKLELLESVTLKPVVLAEVSEPFTNVSLFKDICSAPTTPPCPTTNL